MKMSVGSLGMWLACYLFAIASVDAAINDACQTKEQSLPGTCIPLPQCQRLHDLYSQPRPLPSSTSQLLRSERCGFQLNQSLVCCRYETSCGDSSCHRNVGLINPEFCGTDFVARLIGSNKVGVFEMPWMTLLNYRTTRGNETKESFKCSGALINARYVLTAAHCISNTTKLRLLSVRLGDHDITTDEDCEDMSGTLVCAAPPQNINVESFILHPRYNRTTLVNDIALVRLSVPADTSKDTINPICLPVGFDAENRNLDDDHLIVASWGLPSPVLRKASLPVMSTERCKTLYQQMFNRQISSDQLCAGGTNMTKDACQGDGGGPLMSFGNVNGDESMIQYGVVSYGRWHCGIEGVPDVFTRIAPYMNWILDNMKP